MAGMRKRESFKLSDLQNTEIKNPKGIQTKLKQLGDVEVEFASANEKKPPPGSLLMSIEMSFIINKKENFDAGMTLADVADVLGAISSKSMTGTGKRVISNCPILRYGNKDP